ncbi:TVP38/TMEM64 family protein [Nocardiopsis ansamitocini]|uniref:TVP38/TMEM64 family membrane protein n=1 Tax=Nocardiopsis ansamitocini TaxID=1670832 RepID=A0A9W6P7M4_9ACTN|nr:TVP38/TMEM64 family protein [Nocardiopsis ansamitocini]GLU48626.1 TVP38/TMEM64 family protein [Nocardiopsis ansamitocini]
MTHEEPPAPSRAAPLVRLLRSPWPRVVLLVAILAGCGWLAATQGLDALATAREHVAGLGAWGPPLYVLLYALATVALFPVAFLDAAAGALFGIFLGAALVWAGATLGAVAAFLLGRGLSREAVERLSGGRVDRLNAFLARRGTLAVALVRLFPLFPFTLVNYGSALTAVTLRQYTLGTAIGIVPSVFVYVFLGRGAATPTSPIFLAAVGVLVLFVVGGAFAARRLSRRMEPADRTGDEG